MSIDQRALHDLAHCATDSAFRSLLGDQAIHAALALPSNAPWSGASELRRDLLRELLRQSIIAIQTDRQRRFVAAVALRQRAIAQDVLVQAGRPSLGKTDPQSVEPKTGRSLKSRLARADQQLMAEDPRGEARIMRYWYEARVLVAENLANLVENGECDKIWASQSKVIAGLARSSGRDLDTEPAGGTAAPSNIATGRSNSPRSVDQRSMRLLNQIEHFSKRPSSSIPTFELSGSDWHKPGLYLKFFALSCLFLPPEGSLGWQLARTRYSFRADRRIGQQKVVFGMRDPFPFENLERIEGCSVEVRQVNPAGLIMVVEPSHKSFSFEITRPPGRPMSEAEVRVSLVSMFGRRPRVYRVDISLVSDATGAGLDLAEVPAGPWRTDTAVSNVITYRGAQTRKAMTFSTFLPFVYRPT